MKMTCGTWALVIAASLFGMGCKKKGGDDAVGKIEGFSKSMCECKDKACADKVNDEYTKWGTEMAKTAKPEDAKKADAETTKKMTEAATKYTECYTKVAMGGAGGDTKPAGGDTKPAGGDTQPAAGGGDETKGCPAGFINPAGVGACVKMPEGLKRDDTLKGSGNIKRVMFTGEGGATVNLSVEDYRSMFWEDANKSLIAGGGFGGELEKQEKLGADGVWGVFKVDGGDRKVSASRIHDADHLVECQAWKDVKSTVGPAIDVMVDVCKTVALPTK